MKRWMTALGTLAVTLTNASCAPVVLDAVTVDGSEGSAEGPGSTNVLAILYRDLPAPPAGVDGLVAPDPDALLLMFGNLPETCAAPQIGGVCPDQLEWQTTVVLPPELVRVGAVDLSDPRISSYTWTFYDTMCSGGGGGPSPLGGTLDIVSTDAGSLTVNLIDGLPVLYGFSGDPGVAVHPGTYTVPRCEPAPALPPPIAAVAILGADLPAGLPSSPTIGASADPTALYLFFGSGTQTCTDPLSSLGCAGAYRITLKIPATLQQPGTLDLSDPQLATSIEAAPDGTGSCTSSAGSFTQGTLTIASIDAGGLSFSLYQSLITFPGGPVDADGVYQATTCP